MDAIITKRTLYRELRRYPEVNGAAFKFREGSEFIIIYLTKHANFILQKIPDAYQGFPVMTEVKGEINGF